MLIFDETSVNSIAGAGLADATPQNTVLQQALQQVLPRRKVMK